MALKPAASTPISSAERTSTVASRSPAAMRLAASVTCRTGRTMLFDRRIAYQHSASTNVSAKTERRDEPAPRQSGGFRGFPPHRVLVESQQPIALAAKRGERAARAGAKYLACRELGAAAASGSIALGIAKKAIESAMVFISLRADSLNDVGFPRLGDIAGRAAVRGIEAEAMLLQLWDRFPDSPSSRNSAAES